MLSSNKNKVLEVFFKKPTEAFHVRELARLTNLNPNTMLKLMKNLKGKRESIILRVYAIQELLTY